MSDIDIEGGVIQSAIDSLSNAALGYLVAVGCIDELIKKYTTEIEQGNGYGAASDDIIQDLKVIKKTIKGIEISQQPKSKGLDNG